MPHLAHDPIPTSCDGEHRPFGPGRFAKMPGEANAALILTSHQAEIIGYLSSRSPSPLRREEPGGGYSIGSRRWST